MPNKIDLTGQIIGRLLVIREEGKNKWGSIVWVCKCNCGNTIAVTSSHLRHKDEPTHSCGCLTKEVASKQLSNSLFKHGQAKSQTYYYRLWKNIKSRCYDQNNPGFPNYGERGIGVYGEWYHSFTVFYNELIAEIGLRPSNRHSLDRINNDGHYEPGNVRWATMKEQSMNKRSKKSRLRELKEENQCLKARILVLEQELAYVRIKRSTVEMFQSGRTLQMSR